MLLAHAQALSPEFVLLDGVQYPKAGPFTPEQAASELWEIVYPVVVPPEPSADVDCGCGDKSVSASSEGVSSAGVADVEA